MRLAEIEGGGADEIADILDEHQGIVRQAEGLQRMADHMGVEMAALSGIDLDRLDAGGADALGVVRGLLVAFDHRNGVAAFKIL